MYAPVTVPPRDRLINAPIRFQRLLGVSALLLELLEELRHVPLGGTVTGAYMSEGLEGKLERKLERRLGTKPGSNTERRLEEALERISA